MKDVQLVVLNEPQRPGKERLPHLVWKSLNKLLSPIFLGPVFTASPVSKDTEVTGDLLKVALSLKSLPCLTSPP